VPELVFVLNVLFWVQSDSVFPIKACAGETVSTPYGTGVVKRYRSADQMYEVALPWATAFLNEASIRRIDVPRTGKRRCVLM
jgi:hypothetical protein